MAVRAQLVVYATAMPPGIRRSKSRGAGPMTIERHIGGRRYLTEVPVSGDLSLREVAAFFSVDPATIWRWTRAKRLNSRKERGRLRVPVREIFRFERSKNGS